MTVEEWNYAAELFEGLRHRGYYVVAGIVGVLEHGPEYAEMFTYLNKAPDPNHAVGLRISARLSALGLDPAEVAKAVDYHNKHQYDFRRTREHIAETVAKGRKRYRKA